MANPKETITRDAIRKRLNLNIWHAILGDSDGVIYDATVTGNVYVRERVSGGYSLPKSVPCHAVMVMRTGAAVILGYDDEGKLAVLRPDNARQLAQGGNPLENNPGDPHIYGGADLYSTSVLLSIPYQGSAFTVTVGWLNYVRAGTVHFYPGESGGVDLTSYIPATANKQLVAGLFLKDDDTVEVIVSTEKFLTDPLATEDIQECVDGSSTDSIPIAFWRLYNAMTAIAMADLIADLRQFINIPDTSTTAVQYPTRATMWHEESLATAGNAVAIDTSASSGQGHRTFAYQTPAANGDTFTHGFMLAAGTYTIYFYGATFNNSGKIDWYIDNVITAITAQDWYSAGTTNNVTKSGSITVSTDGHHVLKGVVNGKNASSTDYYVALTKIWIVPSAD